METKMLKIEICERPSGNIWVSITNVSEGKTWIGELKREDPADMRVPMERGRR